MNASIMTLSPEDDYDDDGKRLWRNVSIFARSRCTRKEHGVSDVMSQVVELAPS